MKAVITLTDTLENGFDLRCDYAPDLYNPQASPSHQASHELITHLETIAELRSQEVWKTTNQVTALDQATRDHRHRQALEVYAWLGLWRDHMPLKAVAELQELLGPLPSLQINLDTVNRPPENQVSQN